MTKKQRLELTWMGKDERPRLEPRILIEDSAKSYHAKRRVGVDDIYDNQLVFGDNLLALKALEQEFVEKIKCIYIDPPFNTGEALEHYDDGLEHSIWLSLMYERIRCLHRLLRRDGTFVVHIDANELGYLIAICDEIFGRGNRQYIVTFKQSSVSGPKSINPGIVTIANYILIYAKDRSEWHPKRVLRPAVRDKRYSKVISNFEAGYAGWKLIGLTQAVAAELNIPFENLKSDLGADLDAQVERFVLNNANRVVRTARVKDKDVNESARRALATSRVSKDVVIRSEREGKPDYYFLNGEQLLFYSSKMTKIDGADAAGMGLSNIWDDLLSNNLHNEGGVSFPKGKKPEALLKRVFELFTERNDIVLDSFGGSGTTGAVAQKMGRRWVLVELGEHCDTHILPRLKSVIDGGDKSGITEAVGWEGGGGFRYYRLAPSLLEKDRWNNWIIAREYNAAMLAEAVCKLMGFSYAPSDSNYWMHGRSSERDFIYVTTQSLTTSQLRSISEDVGGERSLLICCKAFRANTNQFINLTIKKIPQAVLRKCEWGHDDYSLNVANLPMAAVEEETTVRAPVQPKKSPDGQPDLFVGTQKQ